MRSLWMIRGPTRGRGREGGRSNGCPIRRFTSTSARRMRSRRSSDRNSPRGSCLKDEERSMKLRAFFERHVLLAAFGVVLAIVSPALAHHSFDAEYDPSKTTNITGYVTKIDW